MDKSEFITVVSGLPRSGTSMMMAMLDAAGVHPIQDGEREADIDNPKGYYEFERVKKLPEDAAWLPHCKGKAVKIISALLTKLPEGYHYKTLWMRRNINEIIQSQTKMLKRRGEYKEDTPSDDEIRRMLLRHVEKTLRTLHERPHVELLFVNYNKMLEDPTEELTRIDEFLGGVDIDAMRSVIDRELYRNRATPAS